ncbi:Holliday junction resolvase-like protein [Acidianus manzaensis]|uniref:Endonuclease n=1 Tax=Acidianus manzaensis TaxID=282676 RepID=A0A1W6K2T6_9CREN|nr:Holliday junction resolvase-like protein [Acidianus manzaensis]ARM76848.1 endonuclease [Acidianus manzaensis]
MDYGILLFIFIIFIAIIIGIIFYYSRKISLLNRKIQEEYSRAQQQAQLSFNSWVQQYSQQLRTQMEQTIKQQYENILNQWKMQTEEQIRRDAIERSINTILGKVGEEFSPVFLAEKYNVNLKDFRHLGSPVDFIAFKGLSDEADPEIIFIEIKSGKSTRLTDRERKIQDAIKAGKVKYEVVNINDLIGEVKEKILKE